MPELNIALIDEILETITKTEPDNHPHLRMGDWITPRARDVLVNPDGEKYIEVHCKTAACLAGWAVLKTPGWTVKQGNKDANFFPYNPNDEKQRWVRSGLDLLGLSENSAVLFFTSDARAVRMLKTLRAEGEEAMLREYCHLQDIEWSDMESEAADLIDE